MRELVWGSWEYGEDEGGIEGKEEDGTGDRPWAVGAEGEKQDGARGWVWYKEAKEEELEVLGTIFSFF